MEKKIIYHEVCSFVNVQDLVGCTITSVQGCGSDENEGLCINSEDKDKNLVSLLISEDGWHFHNGKRKSITAEQVGELAMLAGSSDVNSVQFNNIDPLVEVVIKPIGNNAADCVLKILRDIFPGLEVKEADWECEGDTQPMYLCSDQSYYFHVTVAVMPGIQ